MRARPALLAGVGVFVVCVALGVAIALFLGWRDPAARRSMYDQFPVFPGAVEESARAYRIDGDTLPTRNRGLRVTYELPGDATAAEVIGFYRTNMPSGWTEASVETCAAMVDDGDDVADAETGEGFVLLHRESRLTVFAPGEDGAPDGSIEGIGFTLLRRGERKLLVLDSPDYECGPPQVDAEAAAFDR